MSVDIKFSEICGENVKISEDKSTAIWIPKNSSGWACCEQIFKPGDVIQVKVQGSGRCDIGFMKEEQSPCTFKTLNEIRAHRRTCHIEMTSKDSGDEISSRFAEKTFKKKVETNATYWIAVYIRYGDMSVELLTKEPTVSNLKFSANTYGKNIKLEDDNTKASSVHRNPASICFLAERLQVKEVLNLTCAPEKEGERLPSRYDFKLQVCEKDPTLFRDEYKHLFDALEEGEEVNPPLTTIESFEKDDCNGNIYMTLSNNNTVEYKTARGKQNSQILEFSAKHGVWVVFSLYRVRMKSSKDTTVSGELKETPTQLHFDQPDSVAMPPRATAVPPEDEMGHQLAAAQTPTNDVAVQQLNVTSSDNQNHVKYLEGRVKNLEEELQKLKVQAPPNVNQDIPRQLSNPDINVLTEELGDNMNIAKHFPELVNSIDTTPFCDQFYAKEILTESQIDTIQSLMRRENHSDANRELLKMLKAKRPEKAVMIEVLNATQQQHLLKLFYPRP
ncbi:uncharacterized protein LOC132739832 [Ruditapes philippinarum]|uniref:uncharacterized protein LOC132739832 n=1 Tax=Ruditapes philippinarum TaxID=129788 RepID=UPI00295BF6A9|nr:uncharacterized protein LOC132739832 [Ruditapes philippinarum]